MPPSQRSKSFPCSRYSLLGRAAGKTIRVFKTLQDEGVLSILSARNAASFHTQADHAEPSWFALSKGVNQ